MLAAPGRWTGQGVDGVSGYFFAASENRRLKAELKEMRQLARPVAMAAASTPTRRYRHLLGLRTEPPIPMVAARVVADSRGPFANTRLADAGTEKGVQVGNPVMSERGLVGRVVGVAHGASRVLLLTDIASRTPVMIDRTNARAILTGDGGPNPKLEYLRGQDPVKEGDRVADLGRRRRGAARPAGGRGGRRAWTAAGAWCCSPTTPPIDYVRILLFKDFSQLADQKALLTRSLPPVTTEDPDVSILGPVATTPKPPAQTGPAPAAATRRRPRPSRPPRRPRSPPHPSRRRPGPRRPRPAWVSRPAGEFRMGGARPLHPGRWLGVPALFCVLATIAFAKPIRIYGLQLPEPVFAMVPAFAWALIRPSILAPFALLLLGLFLDTFWGGPTGLWGLSLLVAYATALAGRNMMTGQSRPMMWAWFAGDHRRGHGRRLPVPRMLDSLAMPSLLAVFWQFLVTALLFPVRPPADRPVRGARTFGSGDAMSEPSIFFFEVNERQGVFHRRAFLMGGLAGGGLLALGGRLAQLQLVEARRYQKLSAGNQFNYRLTPPPRGLVLDRNGVALASNRPNFRLMVTKESKDFNVEATLDDLALLVPIDAARRARLIRDIARARARPRWR